MTTLSRRSNMKRWIKGVVFDLDGTLINSSIDFMMMRTNLVSYLIEKGIPAGIVSLEQTVGTNLSRFRDYLRGRGEHPKLVELEEGVNAVLTEAELRDVAATTMVNGAARTIALLREKGYLIGLLTRGSRRYALRALDVAGLSPDLFDTIICRDDVPAGETKPNGKAMERMASELCLSPEECVMIGDHPMDQACAAAAGSAFLGVLTGWCDAKVWGNNGCQSVLRSVTEVPAWLERVNAADR